MSKYILTLTKENINKFIKCNNLEECMEYHRDNKISYIKEIYNNTNKYIPKDCDILAIDISKDDLNIQYNCTESIIKKNSKFLLCIPLYSLVYTSISIYNNNIDIYKIILGIDEHRTFINNRYYITDRLFVEYGALTGYTIYCICEIQSNKLKLFKIDNKELFEKMMRPIKKVLLNANVKLSNRNRLVLFLLRHHAIPPKDIKECNDIESILEH